MQAFHFSPLQIGTPGASASLQKWQKKYEGLAKRYVEIYSA